ncbi:MAG: fibrobacter succinogenes major paralogous domain-containing protein [Bacteroidales bacterium]|nr:fibrobacter succinogenes major paralogous domain-containing protein [Bacteroidales bacterium]
MNRALFPTLTSTVFLIILLVSSCDKVTKSHIAGGTTISAITARGATIVSLIIWNGDTELTECGFCYNTTGNPTLSDSSVAVDVIKGKITWKPYTLKGGTKYFVRSYAKNKLGTAYGLEANFTTKPNTVPIVSTPYMWSLTHNSASFMGLGVSSDNTLDILSKGICWSTLKDPTINDNKIDLGPGTGDLGCIIEGLTPGTVYYFRGFASNEVGISYGWTKIIKTYDGYMTDYEGHIYSTIRLGKQEWMNRNLETRYFSNGDFIKTTGTATINIEQEDKPVYQWAFLGHEDHPELLDDDGRLYTWFTATDSRKLCPAGWHLPSIDEWNELLVHLDGNLRQSYNWDWSRQLNITGAEGGFWAQMAGFRYANGQFPYGSNYGTYWWSSTEASSVNAWSVYCRPASFENATQWEESKKSGFSVRCVKD